MEERLEKLERENRRLPALVSTGLLLLYVLIGVAACGSMSRQAGGTVLFGGAEWVVRDIPISGDPAPPGNNYFGASTGRQGSIHVGTDGRLRLRIIKMGGRWHAAEVSTAKPAVPGVYRFAVTLPNSPPLDSRIAVALFLYADDMHEIDIEMSEFLTRFDCERISCASCIETCEDCRVQFVRQPFCDPGNWQRLRWPGSIRETIHQIEWDTDGTVRLAMWPTHAEADGLKTEFRMMLRPASSEVTYRLHLSIWLEDIGGAAHPNAPMSNRSQEVVFEALALPDAQK